MPGAVRRWWILAVIGIAQLMVILDNSIVNIALPSAQADLGFDDAQRQWVVTAYALAFGSLLLLGGRLSDLFGRRAAFVTGLIGFAAASVLGGLAPNFALLVAARALQGVFGAVLAPAALSLLTTTFPSGRDRQRAFGVFAALAGSGAAIGLLLGGALTEYVDWRWCLYVNAVFAAIALVGAFTLLGPHTPQKRPRLDVLGTITASAGLFCVVYGFGSAETDGWRSALVYGFLGAGVVLLGVFTQLQRRVAAPLLPLRIPLDRNRGGSFLTILVLTTGMFGLSLFLAYVLQQNFGFSPVLTGVAFLPMVASIVTASTTMPSLMLPRVGPKPLIVTGLLLGAGGLSWFSLLAVGSTYLGSVVGPMVLMGLGMGTAMSTSINTATLGVEAADAGVASASVNTMQQVGGSVGTALLSSVAGTSAAAFAALRPAPSPAAISLHGYDTAFLVAAAIFAGAAVLNAFLVPWGRPHAAARTSSTESTGTGTSDGAGDVVDERAALPPASSDTSSDTPSDAPSADAATGSRAGAAHPGVLAGHVSGPEADHATLTLVDARTGSQVGRVTVDDTGAFRLPTPADGDYLLVCGAPGARPVAERVGVVGGTTGPIEVRLAPVPVPAG